MPKRLAIATVAALCLVAVPAWAQTAAQPVVVEPAEADFTVVTLPTTRPLARFKGDFHLTHRFVGNLKDGSFADNLGSLFGADNGAVIGIGYRFGVTDRVQASVYRSSADKTLQFAARIDAARQTGRVPVSVSFIAAIEGNHNFGWLTGGDGHDHDATAHRHKSPSLSAVVSRTFGDRAAVYVVPVWVHDSLPLEGSHRDTALVGLGARIAVRPTVYLVGELTPRVGGYKPGQTAFGFGIEKRAGWHMFQLTLSNTTATTFGQVARGGFPATLYFGFNLGRKFL
jgi:hypothetical protein